MFVNFFDQVELGQTSFTFQPLARQANKRSTKKQSIDTKRFLLFLFPVVKRIRVKVFPGKTLVYLVTINIK
ncbi:MAG: hypothetical protein A2418_01725 [Candidatus Brennerbacteria bacterium RIFOXYC1_FULL_41_11]|nr:MAG: hypothetical protein A2418_01725 [Candidatus Brennerbacteria bacterium RIFOXYC1_FULL_41_11]